MSAAGDVGNEGNFFFVMDQPNETLYHLVTKSWSKKKKTTLSSPQFLMSQVNVATGIVEAVSFLHSKNVMHSDLRPEVRLGQILPLFSVVSKYLSRQYS